jgi:hypothetical protein
MPLILPGNVAAATAAVGFDVDNSCRFNDGDSPYMTKTFVSGNQDRWTYSCWFKKATLTLDVYMLACYVDNNNYTSVYFEAPTEKISFTNSISGSYVAKLTTNRFFRDPSAWYHVVAVYDSGNATAGDRMRLYINGIEQTSFSTEDLPDEDENSIGNQADASCIIGQKGDGLYFDGYMAEVVFIDGTVYAASDFGEFDSDSPTIWKPKDPSGLTFGTNGFYLDFKDSANLGNDANGGTDFSETNIVAADQCTDTPTNSFATANPLSGNAEVFAEGNVKVDDHAGTSYTKGACSTMGVKKGKWYMEMKCTNKGASMNIGVAKDGNFMSIAGDFQNQSGTLMMRDDGKAHNNNDSGATYGDSFTTGDIISVALDMDNRDLYFYKNGVIQNSGTAAFTDSVIEEVFYFPMQSGYNTGIAEYNFGNPSFAISSGNADANGYGNFEYAVPSGYYAYCTKNLAEFGG